MKFFNYLCCFVMAFALQWNIASAGNLYFAKGTKLNFSSCNGEKTEAYNCLYNDSDNHVKCMYYRQDEDVYHIEIPITNVIGLENCYMRGWSQFSKTVLSKYDEATNEWYEIDNLFNRECGVTAGNNKYEGGKQRFDVWTPDNCHFSLDYDVASTLYSY